MAKNIPDDETRCSLGQELGVEESVIQTTRTNNEKDIVMASQKMLQRWRTSKSNGQVAWKELATALVNAKMEDLIEKILMKNDNEISC